MSKPIKILQVFSRYLQFGGEEVVVRRCGEKLRMRYQTDDFFISSEEFRGSGLVDTLTMPARAFHNPAIMKRLRDIQNTEQYDFWLIHNVFPAISPSAYSLAEELGIPIIQFLHNYRFGCTNAYLFTNGKECRKCLGGNYIHGAIGKCWRDSYAQSSIMSAVLSRARHFQKVLEQPVHFIVTCEAQKQIHIDMGIPPEKITIVPHEMKLPANHQLMPFPEDGHALFIGRLSPEKGVDRLLRAWTILPKDRKLVIAGTGPAEKDLQQLAGSLGLTNVEFAGFLDQDAQIAVWEKTLFSVVPSVWQEPFGMVVLEAWSKGRPVVAHEIGALPEIITHARDGFLASAEDPEQLAAALRLAFDSSAQLPEMGKRGFERLGEYYNETRWLEDMSAVFEKLGAAFPKTSNS